jgi:hypothetical protein
VDAPSLVFLAALRVREVWGTKFFGGLAIGSIVREPTVLISGSPSYP